MARISESYSRREEGKMKPQMVRDRAAIERERLRIAAQMRQEASMAKGVRIPLFLDVDAALVVIAQLQLALRHPANTGASADVARELIDGIIERLEDSGLHGFAECA